MKCVILDDEPLAVELITSYINDTENLQLAFASTNAFDAIQFIQKNEVRWETMDMIANKKYKLDLAGVVYVYEGKSTKNLVKVNVSEKLCVSLISQSSTLDLQAEREDEQIILYRGFVEIVESIKKTGGYV